MHDPNEELLHNASLIGQRDQVVFFALGMKASFHSVHKKSQALFAWDGSGREEGIGCACLRSAPARTRGFSSLQMKKGLTSKTFFAERKGFEPSIRLPVYYLSRVAPSTTRTPLYLVLPYKAELNASIYSSRVNKWGGRK